MLTIGERINATRKAVAAAITARDEAAVRAEIDLQLAGGALMLDINGGTTPETETGNMDWLVAVTAAHTDAPLCLDSAKPGVIETAAAALMRARGIDVPGHFEISPGIPWLLINSISAESERYELILPLVKKYNAAVAALCMGDGDMPSSAEDRIRIGAELIERLAADGVAHERVYIDPLVLPVGVEAASGLAVIETIADLKNRYPDVRTVCGLSNVSFGLPARGLLNRTFLALLTAAGLDAAIVDTSDAKLMSALRAALALCNRDPYCADYITAFRNNLLDA